MAFLVLILLIVIVVIAILIRANSNAADRKARDQFNQWRANEIERLKLEYKASAEREAQLALGEWKRSATEAIRKQASTQSRSVMTGKICEQLSPYLPEFPFSPSEVRFIGSPVDFVVFDGLETDDDVTLIVVEVKTNSSRLTARQRRVRDAIQRGRVKWREIRIDIDDEEPEDNDRPYLDCVSIT